MLCICLLEDAWSDDNPPTPVDSLNDEYDAYANMTALKKCHQLM